MIDNLSNPKFRIKTGNENKLDRELAWRRLKKYGVVQGESVKSVRITDAFAAFVKSRLRYTVDQVFDVNSWAEAAGYDYTYRVTAWLISEFVYERNKLHRFDPGELANMAYLLSGVLEIQERPK